MMKKRNTKKRGVRKESFELSSPTDMMLVRDTYVYLMSYINDD